MSESTMTFRVDDALKTAFTGAAKQCDRTAAQLLRDFMRDFVRRNLEEEGYDAWYRRKVEAGERAYREGRFISQEEAVARAEKRRMALLGDRAGQ
jgi:predicted transcriptional regulator